MPGVAIASNDALIEKLKAIFKKSARDGELLVIANSGAEIIEGEGVHILNMPANYGLLLPVMNVVPL